MLTAEQLYELVSARLAAGAEKQPEKEAGGALFSLRERYRKEQPEDPGELSFSAVLNGLLDKAENSVKTGAAKEAFGAAVEDELDRFNKAYDALPENVRSSGPVKEAFDAVDRALDPDRAAFERRMAALMEDFVREDSVVKRLRAGTHPGQTGPKPLTPEQQGQLELHNAQSLKNDLASLLALDNLRKKGDLKAALDPNRRKEETEKVKKSVEFSLAWAFVEQRAVDADGLSKAFGDLGRTDLARRVAPAAEAAAAREELDKGKEQEYLRDFQRDFQEVAEGAVRAYAALRKILDGTEPSLGELAPKDQQALRESYEDNVRSRLAVLVVMDDFRRNGDLASAADRERVDAAAEQFMEENAEGLDKAMQSLTGAGDIDLESVFRRSKRPELALLMGVAKSSIERQARQAGPAGPGEVLEQGKAVSPSSSPEGPLARLRAKLSELKNTDSRARMDTRRLHQELRTLFALRALSRIDPTTPVTEDQVRSKELQMVTEKGEEAKLCRGVLRVKDRFRLERVADVLRGDESQEEFIRNVSEAAGLRKAPKQKKTEQEAPKTVETAPVDYQKQLADSWKDQADLSVECLDNIYGMNIAFHPEYVNPNKRDTTLGYTKENVQKCLPSINLFSMEVGGKPVTDREFASLGSLAIYDPSIAGSFVFAGKSNNLVRLDEPSLWVAADNHSMYVMNCANNYAVIEGELKAIPDPRIETFLHTSIPAARKMAEKALRAYEAGDVAPLAGLIANGVNLGVNYSKHQPLAPSDLEIKSDFPDGDWKEPELMRKVNSDACGNDLMMQGALDLLDRDPRLKQAVIKAGLKEEDILAARAFEMAHRVQKAGLAAMQRLSKDAKEQTLSAEEKEQCVLAMQRMQAMEKNIHETVEAAAIHPKYLEAMKKYENDEEALTEKEIYQNKNDEFFRSEEGARVWKPRVHEVSVKRYLYGGLPPVYREMAKGGIAALDARISTRDCRAARNMTAREIMDGFQSKWGVFSRNVSEIKTTARDLYDQLTKDYKAGQMNYTIYEDRLRTMRELTGGDPRAKIDLQTIDGILETRLEENKLRQKKSLDAMEAGIDSLLAPKTGRLPDRLRHIDEVWGLTPVLNEKALPGAVTTSGGYTKEQFALLEALQEGPGENHLHLSASKALSGEDFAALALAATQTFPEIGVITIDKESVKTDRPNLIQDPGAKPLDYACHFRTIYHTGLDQGEGMPRDKIGAYIGPAIVPARKKAEEALRSFQAGNGSPKELAQILGTGLHQLVKTTTLANPGTDKLKADALLECAYIGRLAELAEGNPALMEEAVKGKYMTQEDLDKAKGLGLIYKIASGAELAQEKLSAAARGEQKLTSDERRACVELLLRRKALQDSACRQATQNATGEKYDKITKEFMAMDQSTPEKRELASAELDSRVREMVGQPDYLRSLGAGGMKFARELLDGLMPKRDAFLKKSDAEILKALEAKPLSKDDPFTNKEYQQPAYDHDEVLARSLQASKREKSAPQSGKSI